MLHDLSIAQHYNNIIYFTYLHIGCIAIYVDARQFSNLSFMEAYASMVLPVFHGLQYDPSLIGYKKNVIDDIDINNHMIYHLMMYSLSFSTVVVMNCTASFQILDGTKGVGDRGTEGDGGQRERGGVM